MSRTIAGSVLTMTAIVAGCATPPPKAAPIDVTLADYTITAPATLPASMATFNVTNTGKEAHQAALVRLDSGKTYADFQAAMKVQGPPPAWIVWLGGTHAAPGGSSQVTIPLEAGQYAWYCIIPGADSIPHVMKGMSAPLTVTASTGAAPAAPAADIDVTMHDYQWDLSKPITAGTHTLKVTTAPGQPHEMVLVRLAPGKTAQDFLTWAMSMQGPPPVESVGGVAVLQAGQVNYTTVDFKAGNYAFICFVPDAKDGQPHAMHGMVKDFAVQ
jgi:uncharacterized cupredoxin-like copper-binding protein